MNTHVDKMTNQQRQMLQYLTEMHKQTQTNAGYQRRNNLKAIAEISMFRTDELPAIRVQDIHNS